jgi:DNA-binding CsgD family transcriptional regulator
MLSRREKQILSLVAIGMTPDEIGDRLYISKETVRKTICNVKVKVNLQKASELSAYYWCESFGASFSEMKKRVLSSVLVIGILYCTSLEVMRIRRLQVHRRSDYTEYIMTTEA